MTSPPNLNELRALAEKATPGPWKEQHWKGAPDGCVYSGNEWIANASVENAAFIAAASPSTVLALLDECERLRAECEQSALHRARVREINAERDRADEHLKHRDTLEHRLLAMTVARDEACFRWEQLRKDNGMEPDPHVEKLRSIGKVTP